MATAPERPKETCRFPSALRLRRSPQAVRPVIGTLDGARQGGLWGGPEGPKRGVQKERKHKEFFYIKIMVEPLLSGIVLGLVPITIIGLFVTAYLQYKRGDRLL